MKKYAVHLLLVAGFCMLATSCEKFLNTRPEGTIAVDGIDYSKAENTFLPVSAAYASMRTNNAFGLGYLGFFEIAADDADKGSTPTDSPLIQEIDDWTFTSNNEHLNTLWGGYFSIVDAANFAVDEMPKYKEAQPLQANKDYTDQCGGEAKVIRAWAYFQLVRLFGNIYMPLSSTYTATQRAALPQVKPEVIYAQIKKDLNEAIEILPEAYGEGWDGRINKYTAWGILAKVHLYCNNMDSAAICAGKLISYGRYSLVPSYREEFRSRGENSTESVFELQYSMLGQTTGTAALPNDPYAFLQGPRDNTPTNMQGWGLCVPSKALRDFFAARGETIRAEVTFMLADRDSTTLFEGADIKRGDNCPEYYNGKVFTPAAENTWAFNGYSRAYNPRLLRYSDILLIYAEALLRGGHDPYGASDAQTCLDLVRTRAQLGTVPATLENILDERRAELCLEEDRFFDIVRQSKADNKPMPTPIPNGFKGLYPIPLKQIQLSPQLKQNEGWN